MDTSAPKIPLTVTDACSVLLDNLFRADGGAQACVHKGNALGEGQEPIPCRIFVTYEPSAVKLIDDYMDSSPTPLVHCEYAANDEAAA